MRPDPLKETLKAHLLKLGYPWPKNLENKSLWWLSTEIKAIQPAKNGAANDPLAAIDAC
jgi:hypothetical protein